MNTTSDNTKAPARATRKSAEAVINHTSDQSPLAAMIAAYEARLSTFGETCVLTDEIARVQSGLPEDPTPADKRKHTIAQNAHSVAAQALLDYQPRDAAELATLAQMFTRLDVCEPEDGIEALARMAAGLSAPPAPDAPNPPSGGKVADMLAKRQEFNGWLERTELPQPQVDDAVATMDQMDERIARAPILTASDAAAKIRLLHHDTTELRHRPELALDILAQVAAFLTGNHAADPGAHAIRAAWDIALEAVAEQRAIAERENTDAAYDTLAERELALALLPAPDMFGLLAKLTMELDAEAKLGASLDETLTARLSSSDWPQEWPALAFLDLASLCQQMPACPADIRAMDFPAARQRRLERAGIEAWQGGFSFPHAKADAIAMIAGVAHRPAVAA